MPLYFPVDSNHKRKVQIVGIDIDVRRKVIEYRVRETLVEESTEQELKLLSSRIIRITSPKFEELAGAQPTESTMYENIANISYQKLQEWGYIK